MSARSFGNPEPVFFVSCRFSIGLEHLISYWTDFVPNVVKIEENGGVGSTSDVCVEHWQQWTITGKRESIVLSK